jgi:hypothetical protein
MKEFYKINFTTPYAILLSILSIGFTALIIWLYFQSGFTTFLIVGLLLTILLLWALYYSLTAKIVLTDKEIIAKTPFGTKKLQYNEIKTIGVYAASNFVDILEKEKYHKRLFFANKFIYLSGKADFYPRFLKTPADYIDIHYRREIYDIIESKIKNFG